MIALLYLTGTRVRHPLVVEVGKDQDLVALLQDWKRRQAGKPVSTLRRSFVADWLTQQGCRIIAPDLILNEHDLENLED